MDKIMNANATKQMKKENKFANMVSSFGRFVNRNSGMITLCLMLVLVMSSTVFADQADDMWALVAGLIQKWVTRLGLVIMFVGGVLFGIGWQSDDPSRKTQGIQSIVAGAIVIAVAQLVGTFFA